jgi:hypothetical protein
MKGGENEKRGWPSSRHPAALADAAERQQKTTYYGRGVLLRGDGLAVKRL